MAAGMGLPGLGDDDPMLGQEGEDYEMTEFEDSHSVLSSHILGNSAEEEMETISHPWAVRHDRHVPGSTIPDAAGGSPNPRTVPCCAQTDNNKRTNEENVTEPPPVKKLAVDSERPQSVAETHTQVIPLGTMSQCLEMMLPKSAAYLITIQSLHFPQQKELLMAFQGFVGQPFNYYNYQVSNGVAHFYIEDYGIAVKILEAKEVTWGNVIMKINVQGQSSIPVASVTGDALEAVYEALTNSFADHGSCLDLSVFGTREEIRSYKLPLEDTMVAKSLINICLPNLEDLLKLDLSGNLIEKLDGFTLLKEESPNLEDINIDETMISSLDEILKIVSPEKLKTLSFLGTPIYIQNRNIDALAKNAQNLFPNLRKINGRLVFPKEVNDEPLKGAKGFVEAYQNVKVTRDTIVEMYCADANLVRWENAKVTESGERKIMYESAVPRTLFGNSAIFQALSELPQSNVYGTMVKVIEASSTFMKIKTTSEVEEQTHFGYVVKMQERHLTIIPSEAGGLRILNEDAYISVEIATFNTNPIKLNPDVDNEDL